MSVLIVIIICLAYNRISRRYDMSRDIYHLGRRQDFLASYIVPAPFHGFSSQEVNVSSENIF